MKVIAALIAVSLAALPVIAENNATPCEPFKPTVDVNGTVHVPAFAVPLSSYISEQARKKFIDERLNSPTADLNWLNAPIEKTRETADKYLQPLLDRAHAAYAVAIETKTMAGVRTRIITPKEGVAARNRERVLINLHGGGFFIGAGAEALLESIPISAVGKIKVVTVDYRQGPEHKFPAASEDVAAVYRELLKQYKPAGIGLYGCAAGGTLAAMSAAWFQKENLPTPGALGIFCAGAFGNGFGDPRAVGSWGGDSRYTAPPLQGEPLLPVNQGALPVISRYQMRYLSEADLHDPLVSPAESLTVLAKFPPTLLITGTRANDMSAAVQTHRQLVKASAEADLHLWDGLGHAFFFDVDLPESKEVYDVVSSFFDKHLGSAAPSVDRH